MILRAETDLIYPGSKLVQPFADNLPGFDFSRRHPLVPSQYRTAPLQSGAAVAFYNNYRLYISKTGRWIIRSKINGSAQQSRNWRNYDEKH